MSKEIGIKASNFFPAFAFDEQRRTAGPENLLLIIILVIIGFYGIKQTPPAKRKAVQVEITSCSTCIFKLGFMFLPFDFRLCSGNPLIGFHGINNRLDPVYRYFNIRIEQYEIIGLNLFQ
ncbi:hypothetical protein D3C87_1439180 [compost metagenome]